MAWAYTYTTLKSRMASEAVLLDMARPDTAGSHPKCDKAIVDAQAEVTTILSKRYSDLSAFDTSLPGDVEAHFTAIVLWYLTASLDSRSKRIDENAATARTYFDRVASSKYHITALEERAAVNSGGPDIRYKEPDKNFQTLAEDETSDFGSFFLPI